MAIRARSFRDAKSQAKSNPELVWWVFMRLSGMALVVLTMFHLFKNYITTPEIGWDYASVVGKYAEVTERLYLLALLTLGLTHGTNGLRYVIDDLTARNPVARFWVKSLAYSLIGVILIFGILALFVNVPPPAPPGG
jgi:succinate dehydrogenase / fumarate reductase membrane anchor subunit